MDIFTIFFSICIGISLVRTLYQIGRFLWPKK